MFYWLNYLGAPVDIAGIYGIKKGNDLRNVTNWYPEDTDEYLQKELQLYENVMFISQELHRLNLPVYPYLRKER